MQFAINGGTEPADVAALKEAGYTVEYQATIDVEDGKVTTSKAFEYKVVVSKDGKVVAETGLTAVKVVDGTQAAKITKHEIQQPEGQVVNTVILGSNAVIKITEYETLAGEKVENSVEGVTFKSDAPGVVVVDSTGKLVPLAAGTANITISKEGLEDYVVPVTVGAEAPKADKLTGLSNLTLAIDANKQGESATVNVEVKDQYDYPLQAANLTVEFSKEGVATATALVISNGKGAFDITAVGAGTATVIVKDGNKVLGTATVTVKAAGTVASYNLETEAEDLTLDLNSELDPTDNELTFKFVTRDAEGLLVENLTGKEGYTVESSDKDEKIIEIDEETLAVTAVGTGKATITIKEGSIVRATKEITVIDTTKPDVANEADLFKVDNNFGGFKVTAADNAKNTVTLTYSDATNTPIDGEGTIEFNVPSKVASIAVNGTQLSNEVLYQLVAKTGTNFVTAYVEEIELAAIGTKISELAKLGSVVTVKFVNEAGYEGTYTFILKAEEAK